MRIDPAAGIYRCKSRIRPQYAGLPKHELGSLLREDIPISETYTEGILFYTGDTTIDLLRSRHESTRPDIRPDPTRYPPLDIRPDPDPVPPKSRLTPAPNPGRMPPKSRLIISPIAPRSRPDPA